MTDNPGQPLPEFPAPGKRQPDDDRRQMWRRFAWIMVANAVIWGGVFLLNRLGPVLFPGRYAFRLDERYDPEADLRRGCPEEMVRVGDVCMDRYEYPNRRKSLPKVLETADSARAACQSAGKRLCTLEEFRDGCSGGGPTGDHSLYRVERACNIASPDPDRPMQLRKSGEMHGCVTRRGLSDAVGNLAEWVEDGRGGVIVGGSYGSTAGSGISCNRGRTAGPGLLPQMRGTRCCKDAPPLPASPAP